MKVLLPYFFVVNTIAFLVAGYDKYLAVKHKRRIPENTLFTLTTLGGCIGMLLAMLLFRHKISKPSFMIKFAGIIFFQILITVLLFMYNYDTEKVISFMVSTNK